MSKIRGTVGNDILKGAVGEDEILGLAGDDRLRGLSGNDRLDGGDGIDLLKGGFGDDVVDGGKGADILSGGEGIDLLKGGEGNDLLDGGKGADQLIGGLGDDTYIVDNVGDRLQERREQGIDTVQSAISYKLTANLENLTLLSTADLTTALTPALNATGNRLNNVLTGNGADNLLQGLGGSDRLFGDAGDDTLDGGLDADIIMSGGLGSDRYIVDNQGDNLIESANQGIDTVEASVDFILGANFEKLTLTGTAISGTGNELANQIIGNASNNTLNGGAGADELIGGSGSDILTGGSDSDRFTYGVPGQSSTPETGTDTITDFVRGTDLIVLSRQSFGLSSSNAMLLSDTEFQSVANDTQAATSAARIVFSKGSGNLFYNPNGITAGFGTADGNGNLAKLSNVTSLASTDILIA